MLISIGQGIKQPNCARIEIDDVAKFLTERAPDVETWWSGHLWEGDRRATDNWRSTQVLAFDIDHHGTATDPKRRHTAPSPERRIAIERSGLPGTCWHHTPRGVRVVFVLDAPCSDVALLERATHGAASLIRAALSDACVVARRDKRGRPIDGYALDEATFDRARLFYMPNAVVQGEARGSALHVGMQTVWKTEELAIDLPPHDDDLDTLLEFEDIADALAKLKSDGDNDGSNELMRCARKALSLGVASAEIFVLVAARWNDQRAVPWAPDQMQKRFEDASRRWESEGRAKVPMGRYMRASLDKILREDREYAGKLDWDELDHCIRFEGERFTDELLTKIEVSICARYMYPSISIDALFKSIAAIAQEKPRNRVTEYLARVEWDGIDRRMDLARAFDVPADQMELAAEYLYRWRLAACARAVDPGCKHDHILVFVGAEKARKSSAFAALAGEGNFADTYIDLDSKDAYLQIQKAWIIEWSEIETVTKRTDVARIKSFLSSAQDDFRAPYDRNVKRHPRRCAFVASSNSWDILHERHANRRFWVLESGPRINLAWLHMHRDQLWAEALAGLAAGEVWWLEESWEERRVSANAEYVVDDPVTDKIQEIVHQIGNDISSRELYMKLGVDPTHCSGAIKATISGEMMRAGFARKRGSNGVRKYVRKQPRLQIVRPQIDENVTIIDDKP